jgi:hypothetical protein
VGCVWGSVPGRVDHLSPVSRQKSSNLPYLDMTGWLQHGGAQPRVQDNRAERQNSQRERVSRQQQARRGSPRRISRRDGVCRGFWAGSWEMMRSVAGGLCSRRRNKARTPSVVTTGNRVSCRPGCRFQGCGLSPTAKPTRSVDAQGGRGQRCSSRCAGERDELHVVLICSATPSGLIRSNTG